MKSKRLKPRRIVVTGFLGVITVGTLLLFLPISSATGEQLPLVDCLFTATSAVCVTGLATLDPGDFFSTFGQVVLAGLIQVGGLGISVIGVMVFLVTGRRFGQGNQRVLKESLNLSSGKGLIYIIKSVAYVTFCVEAVGAILSFLVFSRDYETIQAVGISIFHSLAAFNNAGFDILGNYQSLTSYSDNFFLNIVTCTLIVIGGLGFFVIGEVLARRKLSASSKIVLSTTAFLIASGMILLKITDDVTWLEALFQSITARTAGFASINIGALTNAGLMVLIMLMFIGASPGSTGGGIKTTTFFVLMKRLQAVITNQRCHAFKRTIPESVVTKAFCAVALALGVIIMGSFFMFMLEPDLGFEQIVFEVVSAFSTTGLSTGITPGLSSETKVLLSIIMFIGRLGPLTIATMWLSKETSAVRYVEEEVTIG